MAYISNPSASFGEKISIALSKAAYAVFNFLADLTNAQSRLDQIEAMQRMSDDDLMKRFHIKREDIVHHVFRDKMMY